MGRRLQELADAALNTGNADLAAWVLGQNPDPIAASVAGLAVGSPFAAPLFLDGRQFALQPGAIAAKSYFYRRTQLFGETAYRFEGRPGDNNGGGDSEKIRVGADGYPEVFENPATKVNEIVFWVYPVEGTVHDGSGEFWHAFELHAKSAVGDAVNTTGPLTISTQWSNAAQMTRLRVTGRYLVEDPIVDDHSILEQILFDTGVYAEKQKRRFRIRFREHDTLGQIKVWMTIGDGPEVRVVNYYGRMGYNGRELYPQFRSYCSERPRIVTYYGGFEFNEYDLPLVEDEGFVDPASWTLGGGAIGTSAVAGDVLTLATTGSGGDSTTGFHVRPALSTADDKLTPGTYRISYEITSRSTGSISAAAGPFTNLYVSSVRETAGQFSVGVHTFDVTVPGGATYYVGLVGRGTAAVNMVIDNFTVEQLA